MSATAAGRPALELIRALQRRGVRTAVVTASRNGEAILRAQGFAAVIGVDRSGQAGALRAHGATRVLRDLGELEAA